MTHLFKSLYSHTVLLFYVGLWPAQKEREVRVVGERKTLISQISIAEGEVVTL
jgi:hypothetical protein